MNNKPQQYRQGWTEFYKLKFKVDQRALIPRPETELLVDAVLNCIKGITKKDIVVLDIGTGVGNIAISIAKNLSLHLPGVNVKIIATDISAEALKLAKQNAQFHNVTEQIQFIQSNLLSGIRCVHFSRSTKKQSVIVVTNLPYIPSARIPYLDSSVKDFEPHVALDGGEDGFELYRKLFQQVKDQGWTPKLILGEIDYTHGELALNEANRFFPEAKTEVRLDLAHKQRILIIST